MQKLEEILAKINNPVTGKTLSEENRLIEYKEESGCLHIVYNRDGISPKDKRVIESDIIEAFANDFTPENIKIVTRSKDSQDVFNNLAAPSKPKQEAQPQAQLKTGHGAIGNKKRVEGVKNLICIASGKGGVGKSTVTTNLALSLKREGFKVGIIDADIYGPSIPMMLGSRDQKPRSTEDKKILPIEKFGIKFISFGLFIDEKDPVIWRGPMLGGVLNQFLFDVSWGELDYLLIDLPPGTGDVQLSMVQNTNVDGAIIVSTPQDVALLDALKGLNMFTKMEVPILGMVENMSSFICDDCDKVHYIFGQSGVEERTKELNIKFLGDVPIETVMRECADKGTPYMSIDDHEGRKGFDSYMGIAKNLTIGQEKKEDKGFFSKFLR